jgi:hypothetical protein
MPRKPSELSPTVARAFVRDMKAFFAAGHDTIKADEIAALQMKVLRRYQRPREKRVRIPDIKENVAANEGRPVADLAGG